MRLGASDGLEQPAVHRLAVRLAGQDVVEVEPMDDLDERPVGDPVAVRQAAALEDVSVLAQRRDELGRESRLADARVAENGDDAAGPLQHDLVEGRAKPRELDDTADERRVEPPGHTGGAGEHVVEPPRLDRLRLPFQLERRIGSATTASRTSLIVESPTRISPPPAADFEPLRDDDRVAGRERVPLLRVACDHLAGVDTGANLDPDSVRGVEPVVQLCERLAELDCRANGAQRVVLVHDRDPERGHDRVADELLDRAAVALQHLARGLVVARPDGPKRLGIEAFPQRRRIGDVTEDERDGLPDHEISLGRVERHA